MDYDDSKTGETVVFFITNNPNTYTTNIFKTANKIFADFGDLDET